MLKVILVLLAMMVGVNLQAQEAKTPPQKVILDTDIGDDIDDAYALALIASSKSVRLLGVTTAFGETQKRAQIAAKLLSVMGRKEVPVYAGRAGEFKVREQYLWAKDFQSKSLRSQPAVEFLRESIERNPGEVTLIAIGALTNVSDLLTTYPEVKPKIKRIVIMGGAVYVGYNNMAPPVVEWNIRCDPPAAKVVFQSGVPLVMAGLEATTMLRFEIPRQKRLSALGTPTTDAIAALTMLWGNNVPILFDCMAVAYAMGERFCEEERQHVEIEPDGMTRITPGTPNVTVLVKPQKEAFLDWHIEALRPTKK
jgi:inosine-uridine nucleoside N-ribohydrolase